MFYLHDVSRLCLLGALIGLFQFDVDYMVTISIQPVSWLSTRSVIMLALSCPSHARSPPRLGVFLSNYANEL